jgi:uncharacterized protein (UPF0371 family)
VLSSDPLSVLCYFVFGNMSANVFLKPARQRTVVVISCPLPGNGQLLTCPVQIWQPVQIWHDRGAHGGNVCVEDHCYFYNTVILDIIVVL